MASSAIQNQLLFELKSLQPSEPSTNQTPQENKISSDNIKQKLNFPNYSNFFNLSVNESSPKILEGDNQSTKFDLLDTKNIFDNQTNLDSYSKVFDEKNYSDKFILEKTDQISSIPKSDFKIGELPEPKPNIVYASTNSSSNSSTNSSSGPIGSSGVLADVPIIPPNNPDNFQILLAHSIYNVVI